MRAVPDRSGTYPSARRTGAGQSRPPGPATDVPAMSMIPEYASWLGKPALRAARRTRLARAVFISLAAATDAAVILLVSVGTGAVYHRVTYGDVGNPVDFVQIGLLTA